MNKNVMHLTEQVKSLSQEELEEFLSWLAEYEHVNMDDDWDREIERDGRPGGRLESLLARARSDIAAGKTKQLNEFLDNS